jgi:hypothetical protein
VARALAADVVEIYFFGTNPIPNVPINDSKTVFTWISESEGSVGWQVELTAANGQKINRYSTAESRTLPIKNTLHLEKRLRGANGSGRVAFRDLICLDEKFQKRGSSEL